MYKIITSLIVFSVLFTNYMNAQCLEQVTHLSGTSTVNGVDITVTSSGESGTNFSYCSEISGYYIGFNGSDGSYTFQFSPPVDSVTLSFTAINYGELVKLDVNEQSYPIPSVGDLNDCNEDLATLTAWGNIRGCDDCDNSKGSGWKNTTIPGPISTLTVANLIIFGGPNGSIFTLYTCNSETTGTDESDLVKLNVFPNPADDLLIIDGADLQRSSITMLNALGQNMLISPNIQTNQTLIDCSSLAAGIYYILIEKNSLIETRKVVVK